MVAQENSQFYIRSMPVLVSVWSGFERSTESASFEPFSQVSNDSLRRRSSQFPMESLIDHLPVSWINSTLLRSFLIGDSSCLVPPGLSDHMLELRQALL